MKSYTVHERPDPDPDRIERGEALVFIRDGFEWGAALFGPLWLAAAGLWLPLLAITVIAASLLYGLGLAGLPPAAIAIVVAGLHLGLGFEAGSLRRWRMERAGWQVVGTVQGRTRAECERRFFETWRTAPGSRPRGDEWSRGDIAEANAVLATAANSEPRGSWWPFGARDRGATPQQRSRS